MRPGGQRWLYRKVQRKKKQNSLQQNSWFFYAQGVESFLIPFSVVSDIKDWLISIQYK